MKTTFLFEATMPATQTLAERVDALYPPGTAPYVIPPTTGIAPGVVFTQPGTTPQSPSLNLPQSFIPQEADRLLQELADTDDTWSGGATLYGAGGLFDATRKAKLCVVALQIRDRFTLRGEKVTEALIDQLAHADPDYNEFLDEHTKDRALFLALDQQRERIKTRLKIIAYGGRA